MYADHLYLDTSVLPCDHNDRQVEILQESPSRPYTRVAYLEVFAAFYTDSQVPWDSLRSELCRQTIEVNADAIIEMSVQGRPYSRLLELAVIEVSMGGNTKKLTGVAIRYE